MDLGSISPERLKKRTCQSGVLDHLAGLPIFIVGAGQFRMILKIILKKKELSSKLQAMLDNSCRML